MLKEYIGLIKVILLVLVISGSTYFGYRYSDSQWEAKENAELLIVQKKLAELEQEKQNKEKEVRNEQTKIDNADSTKLLALQATIAANESVNSKLRAEIAKYKSMSQITGNTGVNREFAAVATDAVVYADLFGRANDTATELAYIATESYRRGRNCEMKYDAVRKAYSF